MGNSGTNSVILKLDHFKGFAKFLRERHFEAFSQEVYHLNDQSDIPLLRFFKDLPKEELYKQTKNSLADFLKAVEVDKVYEFSIETIETWKAGKHPLINPMMVDGRDITLVYNKRKLALYNFIPQYTQTPSEIVAIVKEIESLFAEIENYAYKAYHEIQQAKLQEHAEELKVVNEQLKESQEELQASLEELKESRNEIEASNEELQELLTQLEEAQEIILDNESRLREAQAVAHLGSWEWFIENNRVSWSAEMKNIFGYDEDHLDIDFQTYINHLHPDDRQMVEETIENSIQNNKDYSFEHRIFTRDGKLKWILGKGKPVYENGNLIKFTGTGYDITKHKETEEALIKSRDYYLTILDDFPTLIWRCDINAKCNYFNKTWLQWTGKLLEQELEDGWLKGVHPDDVQTCFNTFKEAFNARKAFSMEYRLQKYDGSYGWLLDAGKPIHDLSGNFIGYIGSCFDITEDKQRKEELRQAYEKLKQSNEELINAEKLLIELNQNLEQKVNQRTVELQESAASLKAKNDQLIQMNEYMDNFVYAAAHDLKSPVANLKLVAKVLKKPADNVQKEIYIDTIDQLVTRLENTLDGLVQIIEVQSNINAIVKKVYFHEILEAIKNDLKTAIEKDAITIISDFEKYPAIHYFEPFLQSIIRNLVSNAIKYSSENRESFVKLTTHPDTSYIVLTVEDNGIGIDLKKHQKTLFKPFNRFTQQADGKGIGLHLIKNMVEKNGGKIEVESEPDKGTVFKIYLREYVFL